MTNHEMFNIFSELAAVCRSLEGKVRVHDGKIPANQLEIEGKVRPTARKAIRFLQSNRYDGLANNLEKGICALTEALQEFDEFCSKPELQNEDEFAERYQMVNGTLSAIAKLADDIGRDVVPKIIAGNQKAEPAEGTDEGVARKQAEEEISRLVEGMADRMASHVLEGLAQQQAEKEAEQEAEREAHRLWEETEAKRDAVGEGQIERSNGYIKKGGSVWEFGFNGKTAQVASGLKGLALIEVLLTHPNNEYRPLELLEKTGQRKKGDDSATQLIYSEKEIETLKKAIEDLKVRMEEEHDIEKKEELEEKCAKAKDALGKSLNIRGKPRRFSEKHTKSVSRNIRIVINKIALEHQELANHFNSFLKVGEICAYKPDTEIIWEIS